MKRIKQALLLRRKKKYSRILKIPENLSWFNRLGELSKFREFLKERIGRLGPYGDQWCIGSMEN